MLKRLALLGFAAALVAGPAYAGTIEIGVQWTLNAGFNIQWSGPGGSGGGCGAPNNGGNNCAAIPVGMTLRECKGSQTVKNGGVEVLARVLAGTASANETLWQAESWGQSTIVISTPQLSLNDPPLAGGNNVWVEFQADSPQPGTGFEIQITCSAW